MARVVTKNAQGDLEFQERVTDEDGDNITLQSVELDQIDGVAQSGGDRSPSWLSWGTTDNTLGDGTTEKLVDIDVAASGLEEDTTYTFKLVASDGSATATRTVDLVMSSISNAGLFIYGIDTANNAVVRGDLDTAYSLTSISNVISQSFTSFFDYSSLSPIGVYVGDGGSRIYLMDNDSNRLDEYNLNSPYDPTSVGSLTNTITSLPSEPVGLFFRTDGTSFYVLDDSSPREITQFDMSTPWDISTASNVASNGITGGLLTGLSAEETGKFFYYCDWDDNLVYQQELNTAWDISSGFASSNSFNVTNNGNTGRPDGVSVKPDGTKLFVFDNDSDDVDEYDMTTANDISTLSFVQEKQLSGDHDFLVHLSLD
jgi:DNA-binding beta-propeller fold protein YncE